MSTIARPVPACVTMAAMLACAAALAQPAPTGPGSAPSAAGTSPSTAPSTRPRTVGRPGAPIPADQPAPRTDPNSRLAHEQLLEKAKRGGIDVYFEGDSIIRRWGASDPQYAEMLANWRQNFFGWN